MTSITKFGNVGTVSPAIQSYVSQEITTATQNFIKQNGSANIGSVPQYTSLNGKVVQSTPYTMPTTTGIDGDVLVVSGGNIIYGSVAPPPITYLPSLNVTTLSQGPSDGVQNYVFPTNTDISSGTLGTMIFDARYINIITGSNDIFGIALNGSPSFQQITISAGLINIVDLVNQLRAFYDITLPNTMIFQIATSGWFNIVGIGVNTIRISPIVQSLGAYLGFPNNGFQPTQAASIPTFVSQLPAIGRFDNINPALLISNNGTTSITCEDIGPIMVNGNVNFGLGNLSDIGSLSTSANTLNITTPTTQISNGSSTMILTVDGNDRLTMLSTDYTSLRTTTVNTRLDLDTNTIYMFLAGSPVLVIGNPKTRLWSPGTSSLLTLDDSFVSFNQNGPEKLRIDDNATTLTNGNSLLFLPSTSDGLGPLTTTYLSASSGPNSTAYALTPTTLIMVVNTIPKIYIDSTGININNSYKLPNSDGVSGQVITTDGAGTTTWQNIPKNGLYSQTGIATVANTNAENSITAIGVGSLTIPANYFQNGTSLSWNSGGTFRDSGGGQSFRWRLRSNGGVVFDSTILGLPSITTVSNWTVKMVIVFKSLNNLITSFEFTYSNGSDTRGFVRQQSVLGYNPAIINTLALSVQWTNANINNTITSNFGVLSKIY